MTIAEREEQIIRIKEASFQSELDEQLEAHLREQVVEVVQATIEATLVEEVQVELERIVGAKTSLQQQRANLDNSRAIPA
ncbi:MAG: hypothetical protein H6633_24945 [Anaerolineales bacterium]|nr:hypothetical protein [Anaerolineales bacterium]